MPPRERSPRGSTPAGFRAQLLHRLRHRARDENVEPRRLQNRIAFERLLARIGAQGSDWILKGGFALELRYGWRHRPTKDIDLRTEIPLADALSRLRGVLSRGQTMQQQAHLSFDLGEPRPRTKDLVDLLVIAAVETIDATDLTASLRATFDARHSHPIPAALPPPERSWVQLFERLASEAPASPTTDLDAAFDRVQKFWMPVQEGIARGRRWDPAGQEWLA